MELSRMRLGPATTYALAVAVGYKGTLEQWLKEQQGPAGEAATIEIVGTETLDAGQSAAVEEAEGSTPQARKYKFKVPQGAAGAAATVEITGIETLEPGQEASLTELEDSTPAHRKYKMGVPQGKQGGTGKDGLGVPVPTADDAGKVPMVNADGTRYELGVPSVGGDSAADMHIIFTETVEADDSGITNIVRTTDDSGNPLELSELVLEGKINTIDNAASGFSFVARDTTVESSNTIVYPILLSPLNLSLQSSAAYPAKIRCHAKKIIGNLWSVEYSYANKTVGYGGAAGYVLPLHWPASVYYTFEADAVRQIKVFGTLANGSAIKVYGR